MAEIFAFLRHNSAEVVGRVVAALLSIFVNTFCSARPSPARGAWWYTGLGPSGGLLQKWVVLQQRGEGCVRARG